MQTIKAAPGNTILSGTRRTVGQILAIRATAAAAADESA